MFDAGQCNSQLSVSEKSLRLYIYVMEEVKTATFTYSCNF